MSPCMAYHAHKGSGEGGLGNSSKSDPSSSIPWLIYSSLFISYKGISEYSSEYAKAVYIWSSQFSEKIHRSSISKCPLEP